MRIAIYVRVSHKNRSEEEKKRSNQDYENQLLQLKDYVSRMKDWELVAEYADRMTGTTNNRPEFKKMFADAAQKKFDLLLFWSLDRFSREGVLDTLQYLKRLNNYGVEWWSYKEEYLRSLGVFRDAVLAILASIGQQESIRMSERTLAGLERAKAKGKTLGRRPRVDRQQVISLRKDGKSLREIANICKTTESSVCRILAREGLTKRIPPMMLMREVGI